MYKIVDKKYLEEYYSVSFKMFENCCGVCWCCIRKKPILDEFLKKGFNSFNSDVKSWKLIENLNKFEIFPLDPQESTVLTCILFQQKKEANSKEANLLFSEEDFRELDAADLFINLGTYNYFKKHLPCTSCNAYSHFCEKILKERWCDEWGNFDSVMEKIKKTDKSLINVNNYSTATKWGIIDELINKKLL